MTTYPRPKTKLPSGACDCHVHVYGDPATYPASQHGPAGPIPEATADAYRALQARLGLERVVVVQPSAYGFDNRCTLDAVRALGPTAEHRGRCARKRARTSSRRSPRGVHGACASNARGRLDALGGARTDGGASGSLRLARPTPDGRPFPARARGRAQTPSLPARHRPQWQVPRTRRPRHPGFVSLCRLLDTGRVWVKTSACYETSKDGPPRYGDVARLARTLIRRFPSAWSGARIGPILPSASSRPTMRSCWLSRPIGQVMTQA